MPTVMVNGLTVVHRGSGGTTIATLPAVCNTPSFGGPVPVPYPNIAMSSNLMGGTMTVRVETQMAATKPSRSSSAVATSPVLPVA